jgi:signal transduction histidine kinase
MLRDFLTANRDELIDRCREKVSKRSMPTAERAELEHGIPLFLDQLTQTLYLDERLDTAESLKLSGTSYGGPASSRSDIGVTAGKHGHELLQKGFTIGQVVHDYGDLCQAVTELAAEKEASISVGEFRTLNRCLDNAMADAVTAYADSHDAAVSDQGRQSMNERLGFLAHEMRNLLNSVVLTLDAIKNGSVGFAGATAAVFDRNLTAMRDLIDRSLAEVRLDAGIPMLKVRIALDEFIKHFEVIATLEARSKSIRFTVQPVAKGIAIDADRQMLSAAVSNLLQNAFKFTRPDGHVSLTAHATHDRVLIDIADECGGLPPVKTGELFKPFHQRAADRTGLGLGLSITYRSVEANGGKLQVRNIPGTGCVFTIDLPRQPHISASDRVPESTHQ